MLKQSFNFLSQAEPTEVRIRATAKDKYAGLRGRDYIRARQLGRQVSRVQTSAHAAPTTTPANQERL